MQCDKYRCNFTVMTIRTINLATLKQVKNSVIGNPSAKLQLAGDELFVQTLVLQWLSRVHYQLQLQP